jgi:hypothetical protein
MGIRENRKKVQRSIVFMTQEYRREVFVPELRLIQQTVNGLLEAYDEHDQASGQESVETRRDEPGERKAESGD